MKSLRPFARGFWTTACTRRGLAATGLPRLALCLCLLPSGPGPRESQCVCWRVWVIGRSCLGTLLLSSRAFLDSRLYFLLRTDCIGRSCVYDGLGLPRVPPPWQKQAEMPRAGSSAGFPQQCAREMAEDRLMNCNPCSSFPGGGGRSRSQEFKASFSGIESGLGYIKSCLKQLKKSVIVPPVSHPDPPPQAPAGRLCTLVLFSGEGAGRFLLVLCLLYPPPTFSS